MTIPPGRRDLHIHYTAVSLLAASAIAYLFGRLGFYYRTKEGRRTPRAMLDEFYAERRPPVTALIPSYQEEPGDGPEL